jgi:hypothetical protein
MSEESVPSMEQPKITYEELKAQVRAAQAAGEKITNMTQYYYFMRKVYSESFATDPSNPVLLPEHPDKELKDWVSEEDFLGPQEAAPSMEQPVITYEALKAKVRAAQAAGEKITNMAQYYYFMRKVYSASFATDPNNPVLLPEHPDTELTDWVSEEDFLGTNEIKTDEIEVDEGLPY